MDKSNVLPLEYFSPVGVILNIYSELQNNPDLSDAEDLNT